MKWISRYPAIWRYGVALLAVAFTLRVRILMEAYFGVETPYLLFLASVMLSGAIGGGGPALLATFVGAVLGNYYFLEPKFHFTSMSPHQFREMLLYVGEGVFIGGLCELMHRSRLQSDRANREARQLEAELLRSSERERQRVGHDLHDGLGQQLTGMAFLSKTLSARLEANHSPDSAIARQLTQLLNESIATTRGLARGLSPLGMNPQSLTSSLADLTGGIEKTFHITCLLRGESPSDLSEGFGLHVYRIVQESIRNAIQHGQATRVTVDLDDEDEQFIVRITDNGKGMPKTPTDSAGMGLRIMRYRAIAMGAKLSIESAQPSGAVVQLVIPKSVNKPVQKETWNANLSPQ